MAQPRPTALDPGSRRVEAPDGPGVFEEVCRSIDWLRNREKRRKKQLATYLKRFGQATAALRDAALLYLSRLEQDDGVARPEPVCVADLLSEIYHEAQTVEGGVRHLYALEMDATLSPSTWLAALA